MFDTNQHVKNEEYQDDKHFSSMELNSVENDTYTYNCLLYSKRGRNQRLEGDRETGSYPETYTGQVAVV